MKSTLCKKLDIQFPLFAFSHCRNVVTEVSRAGGFGVLGAVGHTPETLKIELDWIEANIDGKPYGIDLLIPSKMAHKDENAITTDDLIKLVLLKKKNCQYAVALLAHRWPPWRWLRRAPTPPSSSPLGAQAPPWPARPPPQTLRRLGAPPSTLVEVEGQH